MHVRIHTLRHTHVACDATAILGYGPVSSQEGDSGICSLGGFLQRDSQVHWWVVWAEGAGEDTQKPRVLHP